MTGFRALRQNHDFTVLWVGQTISELGSRMSLFVFPLLAYAITGSTLWAALAECAHLVGLCGMLLPAGVLADRMDRLRLMRLASATGFLLYASLVVAALTIGIAMPHLLGVALLTGAGVGLFGPAETSAVRAVVPDEQLAAALSQNQARQHVASLLGGPLGAVLYAVTRWLPFAVDAITYAIACVTVSRVRTDLSAPRRRREPLRRQLAEGFRFVWQRPFFRTLMIWSALANLVTNAIFFVVLLRMVADGVPAWQIGLVSVAAGTGGLIGAGLAPSLIHRMPTGRLTVLIGWMCCLPLVPLTVSSSVWTACACTFFLLLLNPVGNDPLYLPGIVHTQVDLLGRNGPSERQNSVGLPRSDGVLLLFEQRNSLRELHGEEALGHAPILPKKTSSNKGSKTGPGPVDHARNRSEGSQRKWQVGYGCQVDHNMR